MTGDGKNGKKIMVKCLINFILIFIILTSSSLAKKITDTDLQNEYGRDLTHVPFFLRNAYYLKYHVDWKSTYFTERKVFLRAYDTNLAAEQVKEKALAKAEAAKEKERLRLKKQEDRKIKDRLKAQADEEKAEE